MNDDRAGRRLPIIHRITDEENGPFQRQHLDLEFSNGERRRFERLVSRGHGRWWWCRCSTTKPCCSYVNTPLACTATSWGWSRPDRRRRDPEQAADRELKEEAGYGARRVDVLRAMTLAPTYMSHQSWLVVARDLYPEKLAGDEPEELEVVPWKLADLDQLMLREDFSEGRSLAALFIARQWLQGTR